MRIIIPTETERKANYSYAWTGYDLDKTIEESDKRNSVSVISVILRPFLDNLISDFSETLHVMQKNP